MSSPDAAHAAPEWREYWAFEHVNRRGVAVDMPFVRRAAALAAEDAVAIGRRLVELTDGTVTRVTRAKRLAAWLHDQLTDAAMREVLTLGVPADDDGDDDDDDQAEPHKLSLTRDRVARVLAMLEAKHANGGSALMRRRRSKLRRYASMAPGPRRRNLPALSRNKSAASFAISIVSPAPGRPAAPRARAFSCRT